MVVAKVPSARATVAAETISRFEDLNDLQAVRGKPLRDCVYFLRRPAELCLELLRRQPPMVPGQGRILHLLQKF